MQTFYILGVVPPSGDSPPSGSSAPAAEASNTESASLPTGTTIKTEPKLSVGAVLKKIQAAKKAKKIKKIKVKPPQLPNNNHPAYGKMVTAAILAMGKNGSSHDAIVGYIRANWNVKSDTDRRTRVANAIKAGVRNGIYVRSRRRIKLAPAAAEHLAAPTRRAAAARGATSMSRGIKVERTTADHATAQLDHGIKPEPATAEHPAGQPTQRGPPTTPKREKNDKSMKTDLAFVAPRSFRGLYLPGYAHMAGLIEGNADTRDLVWREENQQPIPYAPHANFNQEQCIRAYQALKLIFQFFGRIHPPVRPYWAPPGPEKLQVSPLRALHLPRYGHVAEFVEADPDTMDVMWKEQNGVAVPHLEQMKPLEKRKRANHVLKDILAVCDLPYRQEWFPVLENGQGLETSANKMTDHQVEIRREVNEQNREGRGKGSQEPNHNGNGKGNPKAKSKKTQVQDGRGDEREHMNFYPLCALQLGKYKDVAPIIESHADTCTLLWRRTNLKPYEAVPHFLCEDATEEQEVRANHAIEVAFRSCNLNLKAENRVRSFPKNRGLQERWFPLVVQQRDEEVRLAEAHRAKRTAVKSKTDRIVFFDIDTSMEEHRAQNSKYACDPDPKWKRDTHELESQSSKRARIDVEQSDIDEVVNHLIWSTIAGEGDDIEDDGIHVGPQRVSLRDPLSMLRIRTPVKGRGCRHLGCFDLDTYVRLNESLPKFKCPVCDAKLTDDTGNLLEDSFFKALLDTYPAADTVWVYADGTHSAEWHGFKTTNTTSEFIILDDD
ncbi:SUMO ligase siz1 [Rhizophlyctis rosea]|nr:SUMO ligase siz1 [Rhizophlyctis rosea]